MASISIAAYSVRVRPKRSDKYEVFGSFDGKTSFGDVVDQFLAYLAKDHAHDVAAQSLQRARDLETDGDVRSGILEAGEYGYGAELIDVESGKMSYERLAGEAELYPFYFLISTPAKRDRGVMLFQRHGAKGVYTSFSAEFRRWFGDKYPDYFLVFSRLVPPEVMKFLLSGRLKAIEITTFSVPKDQTDKIPFLGNVQDVGEVTTTYTARKTKYLSKAGWLKRVLGGNAQLLEIPDSIGNLGDRVRVSVEYEGKLRQVDFAKPDSIAPYIDCSSEVKLGENGHPKRDSIHAYAEDLLQELNKQLGY
jgi:hypothetical protein